MDRADVVQRSGSGDLDLRPAAGRDEHRVTGLVEAGPARVHERRRRLLLLAGVWVDGAVLHGELAAGTPLEAGVDRSSPPRYLALLHERERVRLLRLVDQREGAALLIEKLSVLKCIVSAIERLGTNFTPPTAVWVAFPGRSCATAGTTSTAAARTASAGTASRVSLRRVIVPFSCLRFAP